MKGFTAAVQLANRASARGFLVEYIVLAASVIDGMLRIGLILQHQIKTFSVEVPEDLVYQAPGGPVVREREIYRRALADTVVPKEVFEDLQSLYSDRNRVVHRYVISDITTAEVFAIARRFEDAIPKINACIRLLEKQQIDLGVGMTVEADAAPHEEALLAYANEKHGADWLARAFSKRAT
jgi:uncharacterized protein YutE (UPF0331/DUF86 family)